MTAVPAGNTFEGLFTAVVLDALDSIGLTRQSPQIPLASRTFARRPLIGRAKTLQWVDFDYVDPATYALELQAVDSIHAGEVVLCATGGSARSGIWGELLTTAARARGACGMVTDGAVRDLAQMTAMEFPVYSQHLCPYDSMNRQKVVAYDVPVQLGGVAVAPGDLIVADIDGVAIVPAAVAAEVLSRARAKIDSENAFRAAVRGGMPLVQAYSTFGVL